jgi:hypothetical protein
MDDRCLVCHADLLGSDQDFHAIMIAQGKGLTCRLCHSEHRGAQAALVRLELADFPHDGVGFSLRAHRQMPGASDFTCADCHAEDFSRFDEAVCQSCHLNLDSGYMEAHTADFGQSCLACHDGIDSYGEAFDHNRLAFTLLGGHANIACAECHTGARQRADLENTVIDCDQCHTPENWQTATIDHSLTAFPLTGAHAGVECQDCHAGRQFKGTPQDCIACHAADDAHQGSFGQDCSGCHTPDGWEAASFDHSLAAFTLTGAHLGVECVECHINQVFKGTPQECSACHIEPDYHRGLFDAECAACHTTDGWSPARYDRAHSFPINHGESGLSACSTCHPDSLTVYTCYGCHEHNPGNIEAKHREEGISNFQDCLRCHPTGREEEGERQGGDD